jgi:hypothetical protein
MASLICFQRSGGCPGFFPCAVVPGTSAVKGDVPGSPGGLVAFGGAVLESIFGGNVPGTPVGLATVVAAESLATDLASESAGLDGVDFIDTVSWAGGGAVTTSFAGAGAGDGAVEAGTSLLATRLEESGGNSAR